MKPTEELISALAGFVTMAQDMTEGAIDETPAILQEYLNWMMISHSMDAAIELAGLILCAAFLYGLRKYYKKHVSANSFDNEGLHIFSALVVSAVAVVIIFCAVDLYHNGKEVVHITVAPKAYLVDKAFQLTR